MAEEKDPPWKRELLLRRRRGVSRPAGGVVARPTGAGPVPDMRLLDKEPSGPNLRNSIIMLQHNTPDKKNGDEDDCHSDSSEELQYGPGIVNKLKTKYLSMTLRENQKKMGRPSLAGLRRATSLENMLDEEQVRPKPHFLKKSNEPQKTPRVYTKTMGGSESMKRARSMDTLLKTKKPFEGGALNGSTPPPRAIVIKQEEASDKCKLPLSEKELPPPDLVKQTLKIFEPSTKKVKDPVIIISKPKISKPPLSNRPIISTKPPVVDRLKSNAVVKPVLSPKPILSPEKRVRPKVLSKPVVVATTLAQVTTDQEKPVVPPRTFNPAASSPLPTILPDDEDRAFKFVSQTAMDNICKEGTTVKYCFNDSSNLNQQTTMSHLPQEELAQATNTTLLASPPQIGSKPVEPPSSSSQQVKQIAVIRPVITNKPPSPQHGLTDREIEKNHINRVKSIEPPVPKVITIRNDVDFDERKTNSASEKTTQLWDKKPWQSQNSVVFNFSDRKNIPDYIENDGLILASRRSKQQQQLQHGQQLNGGSNEDDVDSVDEDYSGPPSPCNIRFIGDNILINGKSNLRKEPRTNKVTLRIQFNDEATTLFEYPADDYIAEEVTNVTSITSLSLGGGGSLSSYTPSKTGGAEGFELGVTRATPQKSAMPSNNLQQDHNEYLKPIETAEITHWSQETTADILF